MSMGRVSSNGVKERIGQLCSEFKLPTVGAEAQAPGSPQPVTRTPCHTLVEVLEQEAEDRAGRGASSASDEHPGCPSARRGTPSSTTGCRWRSDSSSTSWPMGASSERGFNVLAFGLPGTGKTHAMCAIGHRLVESGRSVLFTPAYRLVQDMLAAKRDLNLPRMLRKLDNIDFLLIDDLGYLPQGAEESEVLFTLIAERYERRSLGITSNLVFSQWEKVFANPMATAAAIDRIVHHSIILEFDVPSYRT